MNRLYDLALDVHKKGIRYCRKLGDGSIVAEGSVSTQRKPLGAWVRSLPSLWCGALEATLFAGWIYDFLRPHAPSLQEAHPAMMKAISASKKKNDKVDARTVAVDPDNRLAASELEAHWNAALCAVGDVERKLRENEAPANAPKIPDTETLRSLAQDLPAVWNASTTDMRLEQRIARILILASVARLCARTLETGHQVRMRHTGRLSPAVVQTQSPTKARNGARCGKLMSGHAGIRRWSNWKLGASTEVRAGRTKFHRRERRGECVFP